MAPNPHVKAAVEAAAHALLESLDDYRAPHTYLNFAETKRDSRSLFSETAYHRLRRVKAAYDPENVMRSNHELD
jgi:FAD/FMN-containing dehydrogenase